MVWHDKMLPLSHPCGEDFWRGKVGLFSEDCGCVCVHLWPWMKTRDGFPIFSIELEVIEFGMQLEPALSSVSSSDFWSPESCSSSQEGMPPHSSRPRTRVAGRAVCCRCGRGFMTIGSFFAAGASPHRYWCHGVPTTSGAYHGHLPVTKEGPVFHILCPVCAGVKTGSVKKIGKAEEEETEGKDRPGWAKEPHASPWAIPVLAVHNPCVWPSESISELGMEVA
jgi:hypothetical protein